MMWMVKKEKDVFLVRCRRGRAAWELPTQPTRLAWVCERTVGIDAYPYVVCAIITVWRNGMLAFHADNGERGGCYCVMQYSPRQPLQVLVVFAEQSPHMGPHS